MAKSDNLDYDKRRSMDELLEQYNPDPQFNRRGYQNVQMPREFPTDETYMGQRGNVFFPEQYPASEQRNTLPFMFNTREDVMPAMVRMGGGNFMVYGTPNVERTMTNNFANKTNGSLSGYPGDYAADYNLFSSGMSSFNNTQPDTVEPTTPHVIENLVGHWGSDQSGTYSPFGSCVRNGSNIGDISQDRGVRKTRIVAEVRPMRPSYSDVLAKSVPNNQKPEKQSKQPAEGKSRPPEVKNKGNKSAVNRSLSGHGHFNGRNNLPGSDEVSYSGSNSSLKGAGVKKLMDLETDEPLSKKWVSLDDLIAEPINKETSNMNSSKKVKDGWETIQLNNAKPGKSSSAGAKKSQVISGHKVQPVVKEKEAHGGPKIEPSRGRMSADDRKGPTQGKTLDGSKIGRRNSRGGTGLSGTPTEKGKKAGRGRRRDADGGWPAQVARRFDVLVSVVVRVALKAVQWFVSLVLDVFAQSTNLGIYMCSVFWCSSMTRMTESYGRTCNWLRGCSIIKRILVSRFWPFRRVEGPHASSEDDDDTDSEDGDTKKRKKRLPGGLKHNLPLPSTGEEAMKRLLACKGKDPYSILGVSQDCTDDDIKKYYKRQAFLVHPDKNNQPGAEEAFKILVHAFDIIGEPEHRKSYDLSVQQTAQAEQAWSELSDLLAQLHKKMEYVANTLRCTNCGKRHKRSPVNRPIYAARMCAQCKIHHSVREGDIWAETSLFGLTWRYFACMDGAVYDISEWAACQGNNLKNLKPNTHQVQYRIVLGKQAQKNRSQASQNVGGEPDLEEFINNLYSKPDSGGGGEACGDMGSRNRKHKRKK